MTTASGSRRTRYAPRATRSPWFHAADRPVASGQAIAATRTGRPASSDRPAVGSSFELWIAISSQGGRVCRHSVWRQNGVNPPPVEAHDDDRGQAALKTRQSWSHQVSSKSA